jgi:hypothetical protein
MQIKPRGKLLLLAGVLLAGSTAWTADLTATGGWSRRITAGDLTAGAGSDLASQQESDAGATTLAIASTGGAAWQIKVRHSPSTWHSNFTLWVKRTSDGTGAGSITGGSGYIEVTQVDTVLFSGTKDRSSISLQYKLTGLSKNVSPNSYLSSVVFSVE